MGTWLLIRTLFKGVGAFFGGLMKFLGEHPAILGMIATAIVSAVVTWNIAVERTEKVVTAKYEKTLKDAAAVVDARDKKIAQVEADSKKAADEAKTIIATKDQAIEALRNDYEKKLTKAKTEQKIKVVTVEIPGTKETTDLYLQDGTVSCRRLPSTFVDTINGMVDVVNTDISVGANTP